MNVCMVTPTYFPILGGTEEVIYNLASKLRELGHSAVIVAPQYSTNASPYGKQSEDFEVRFPFSSRRGFVMLTQNRNCIREVVKADEMFQFDVIHHFHVVPVGIACLLIRRKLGKPLITSLMGADSYSHEPTTFYRLTRPLAAVVMNSSDAVTSPSNDLAQRAYKTGCHRKIELIPHGVDPVRFDNGVMRSKAHVFRKRLGLRDNETVVLTVSRLVPRKNLQTLIFAAPEILRRNPNVKFVIVGDGPEYPKLLALTHKLGVTRSFKFVGRASAEDIPVYYGIADLFVLTSLYEAFGVVILEAMAASKPVIASNVGPVPEIIQDRATGLLFPPRDSESLAILICRVLEDAQLRIEMGNRAKKFVEAHYAWKHVARLYLDLYEKLLD